jgi:uncharacterized protein (TIGR02246 family)
MTTNKRMWVGVLVLAPALTAGGWLIHSAGSESVQAQVGKNTAPSGDQPKREAADVAAVRRTEVAFTKAFNAGDAEAMAALWVPDGEYVGHNGEKLRGRAAIAKAYAEFFKRMPKARVEVHIDSIRLLGKHTALEEGSLKLYLPGDTNPGVSHYSVLHVRDDDGWRMATVREWVPDPAEFINLKEVEWLVGAWTAKSTEGELSIRYTWDEDKAFLRGRYVLKRDGKVATSGTQVIGKNPSGGLRSWVFDASGSFGESVWTHDEGHWVIEAHGTLPDGSATTAVNILVPLGPDAFTWQVVQHTAAGAELPGTAPIKVTRVKTDW